MMDPISLTDSQVDPAQPSPSISHFDDEALITLQARNTTAHQIVLGNKLAKPLIVEQSPSSGFAFSRASAPVKFKDSTKPTEQADLPGDQVQAREIEQASITSTGILSEVASRLPRRILSLSTADKSHNVESIVEEVNIEPSRPATSTKDLSQTRLTKFQDTIPPVASQFNPQDLQALASTVNAATLIKILAFTHHKETKQHNELVASLRADMEGKDRSIASAVEEIAGLKRLEQDAEEHINRLESELDNLKRKLEDARNNSKQSDNNVVLFLKAIDTRLSDLMNRQSSVAAKDEDPRKAHTTILQLSNDFRECRKERDMLSSRNLAVAATQENAQPAPMSNVSESKRAVESQELPYTNTARMDFVGTPLTQSPIKRHPPMSRLQDSEMKDKEESQELPYNGNQRVDSAFNQKNSQAPTMPPPLTLANESVQVQNNDSRFSTSRPAVNKFNKRLNGDAHSDEEGPMNSKAIKKPATAKTKSLSKTPRSRTSSQSRAGRVGQNELRNIEILKERNVNITINQTAEKEKTPRGQGGG